MSAAHQGGGVGQGGAGAVVTALLPDPRLPGAVRIEIDGKPFATLAAEAVAASALAPGLVLNDAARERLGAEADAEAAYRTALRALERRSFARADLARRLQRKGHPREAVDAALHRLEERGLLDDAAFAANYVETRAARGRGAARLTRDLLAMGVERRLVDAALAMLAGRESDQTAMLRQMAERRAQQLGDLPRHVKRRRLLAYFARRGFTGHAVGDLIVKVVR